MERIAKLLKAAISRLKAQGPFIPLLWLCATVTPMFLLAAYYYSGHEFLRPYCPWMVIAGFVPPAFVCLTDIIFVIFNPSGLLSEQYQLQKTKLDFLQHVSPDERRALLNPLSDFVQKSRTGTDKRHHKHLPDNRVHETKRN
jgi:hypothetical protein